VYAITVVGRNWLAVYEICIHEQKHDHDVCCVFYCLLSVYYVLMLF